jgi:pimeloyl-ACP methyl ester carboxylesterase
MPYTSRRRSRIRTTRVRLGAAAAAFTMRSRYPPSTPPWRRGQLHGFAIFAPVSEVSDETGELDGLPVFWRRAPQKDVGASVPLYLHGVPNNCDDWLQFLPRSGGLAPDLPGFGRSGKPGSLSYTIAEYDRFLERFLDLVGVERVSLVMHDWGGVGLAFAQRHPDRVERLVLINTVPFLSGYRWHRTARIWRTPVLGELLMGSINRRTLKFFSKESNATPGPLPEAWLDSVLDHFDHGTQRAILRLYRSSPPEVLAQAGAQLASLSMPALVVWGMRDPYIPARFGQAYASALGNAELVELPDAGHWPWLDRAEVIDRVVAFLGAAPG